MSSLARRLAHEERGISLPELLLSMVLMLIVLGATLTTFTNFESDSARAAARNESQGAVRRNVGQIARQLRNLASPNATAPQAVERALPADLVFQTVDPIGLNAGANQGNVHRVRYCVDNAPPARMWMQWEAPAPPATPADGGACPGSGWPSANRKVIAQGVTNDSRPVFTYNATEPTAISAVNVDLFVDMDPLRPPGETRLQSGAFLRNQNRPPTAAFAATTAAAGKVTLNGSPSSDPEGQPLTYVWMARTSTGAEKRLGGGITCECPTDADAYPTLRLAAGTYTVWLKVTDPGGLTATSPTQTMVIS